MAGKDYSLPERAALLALMGIGRRVSNPELQQLAGFTLTGKPRTRLEADGLITCEKQGQAFVHELTDKGWRWCADELGSEWPPRADKGYRALYVVLAGLGRYLQRSGLQPADVFGPAAGTAAQPAAATGTSPQIPAQRPPSGDLADRIRTAYRSLARGPGEWVSLAQLRQLLGDAPRDEVDAALRQLSRDRQVNLVPQSNQKVLSPDDRAAALRLGEQENHLMSMEVER